MDGDGVPNWLDYFPCDASEQYDNDGDGLGDNHNTPAPSFTFSEDISCDGTTVVGNSNP